MEPEPDNYHVLDVACCATCKYEHAGACEHPLRTRYVEGRRQPRWVETFAICDRHTRA